MAALAILEEYVEKKGTLDNLSVDVAQEKKKTSYFVPVPNGNFSDFKDGTKIKKKVQHFRDVADWIPSTLEPNMLFVYLQ